MEWNRADKSWPLFIKCLFTIFDPPKIFLIHFNFKYFPELALPRDVDVESPLSRHPDDCKVYFNGNFPMTCGEGTAFSTEDLTCVPEEEADC